MSYYSAEKVLQSLSVDCDYYESTEEWDKLANVMNLFKYVKSNAKDGLIYFTQGQRDVYLCGESYDYDADYYAS